MTDLITTTHEEHFVISATADRVAARHVFDAYKLRKARNTLLRQRGDLSLFSTYLTEIGISVTGSDLQNGSEAWVNISWGIVSGFVRWMLQQGYAVSSSNIRLSTVKTYAGLAFQSGVISDEQHTLIQSIHGFRSKEARHIDEERTQNGVVIRVGNKKVAPVSIAESLRNQLKKSQPDTPQGRRDALLMCILLDHGLRCGELALLTVGDVDLEQRQLRFYRPKVDKIQTHRLSDDTMQTLVAIAHNGELLPDGPLLRASSKSKRGDKLAQSGMSTRAITKRVEYLGRRVGLEGLSAHDGRHSWATTAARHGTDPFALQEAGGWNSLAMPRRYVEAAEIANAQVRLAP